MRKFLAILVCKLGRAVGKLVGKGSSMPGKFALKICPDILARVQLPSHIIAVTGSNGKTSTVEMIAAILRAGGKTVVYNEEGSNQIEGVTTLVLTHASLTGRVRADVLLIESDERYAAQSFRYFHPTEFVITNLYRDQLTRNGHPEWVYDAILPALHPETELILNADDPLSSCFARGRDRVKWFGLDRCPSDTASPTGVYHDGACCPVCHAPMEYDYVHYNHIGGFQCSKCGYINPQWSYTADNVDFSSGDFTINGCRVHTDYKDLFNILNTTAAVAACTELGLPLENCCQAVSTFVALKQRYDEFQVGSRRAVMILSKNQNPVSFDQSITHVLERDGEKTVVVFINNINHTGHRDTTWLYDIGFERLLGKVDAVVGTGPRAYDLAVRLKLAGFPPEQIRIERDLSQLKAVVDKTRGDICILTELYDAKSILEVISK